MKMRKVTMVMPAWVATTEELAQGYRRFADGLIFKDPQDREVYLKMAKCTMGTPYRKNGGWEAIFTLELNGDDDDPDQRGIMDLFDESKANSNNNTTTKNGGCYIATCVYGSYDCPQVWTLRRYRDNILAETALGRAFIKIYYAISPTVVKYFGEMGWFKKVWKKKLDKMILRLQNEGVKDTPYKDKKW